MGWGDVERLRRKEPCPSVTCVTADVCRGVGSVPAHRSESAVGVHLPRDGLCMGAGKVELVKVARLQTATRK